MSVKNKMFKSFKSNYKLHGCELLYNILTGVIVELQSTLTNPPVFIHISLTFHLIVHLWKCKKKKKILLSVHRRPQL